MSFLPNFLFLGLHFQSIPTLVSLPQAPLPSAPPSFLPFSSAGPPLPGCCETPMVSLAEAQQELQMLRKQLGESEHFLLRLCACEWWTHTVCLCMALAGWQSFKNNTGVHAISGWLRQSCACCFGKYIRCYLSHMCVSSVSRQLTILLCEIRKELHMMNFPSSSALKNTRKQSEITL